MTGQDLTEFFGGGDLADRLAKAKKLRAGAHAEKAKKGSEFPFLGTRNGELEFTYGQDKAPVPDGTLFMVNLATAQTGWAYWANRKKTQQLASIWSENPIEKEQLPDPSPTHDSKGNPIEWGPAYSWQLAAINGPMKGVTVCYEGTANYMLDISEDLIRMAANRMETDPDCFPIIQLYNDPYPNADNGNPTSKHQFTLYGWGTPQGEIGEMIKDIPGEENDREEETKAPVKRRTRRTK